MSDGRMPQPQSYGMFQWSTLDTGCLSFDFLSYDKSKSLLHAAVEEANDRFDVHGFCGTQKFENIEDACRYIESRCVEEALSSQHPEIHNAWNMHAVESIINAEWHDVSEGRVVNGQALLKEAGDLKFLVLHDQYLWNGDWHVSARSDVKDKLGRAVGSLGELDLYIADGSLDSVLDQIDLALVERFDEITVASRSVAARDSFARDSHHDKSNEREARKTIRTGLDERIQDTKNRWASYDFDRKIARNEQSLSFEELAKTGTER